MLTLTLLCGKQVVAVLKFSGYATKEVCSESCRALRDRLQAGANVMAWLAAEHPMRIFEQEMVHRRWCGPGRGRSIWSIPAGTVWPTALPL